MYISINIESSETMNYNLPAYCIYFIVLLFIVLYVGVVLYKNGRPFLLNIFSGNNTLADAINKFLLAGYYLVNIGYTILFLKIPDNVNSYIKMFNILGTKVGGIVFTLGIMHCINIISFVSIGKTRRQKQSTTNINQ